MDAKVINYTKSKVVYRWVCDILKFIPPKDLIGLSYIAIQNLPTKKKDNSLAAYFPSGGSRKHPYIELYMDRILWPKRWWWISPQGYNKRNLASVLLHEIGHHYHHRTHGIAKKIFESTADAYRYRMKEEIRSQQQSSFRLIRLGFLKVYDFIAVLPDLIHWSLTAATNPTQVAALWKLGSWAYFLGCKGMSFKCFSKVLAINPSLKDAHNWLGDYYYDKKDFKKAIEHWKQVTSNSHFYSYAQFRLRTLKSDRHK